MKHAEFSSKIIDKTVVKEQVSECFCVITEHLEIEDVFVGFFPSSSSTGEALFELFKDVPLRLSLPIQSCSGQFDDQDI